MKNVQLHPFTRGTALTFLCFSGKGLKYVYTCIDTQARYFQRLPVLKLNRNSPWALPYLQMQAPLTLSQSFRLFREWHLIESIT